MRVWIDLTNSPHVLVMRPVIEVLRARGDEVRVTARNFAQTVALCERFGIEHEVIGHHRGARMGAKAVGPNTTTVLIAGDDTDAKAALAAVISAGGVDAIDAGALSRARELEAIGFLQLTRRPIARCE